jgi:hypothetical protein
MPGVMFITLEDETANANLIVWPSVFEKKPPHYPRRKHARLHALNRGSIDRQHDVFEKTSVHSLAAKVTL